MFLINMMTKRKATTFRLDERIIDVLDKVATRANNSRNKYLEILLMEHFKSLGDLPEDFQPLGETRGGDRSKG